MMFNRLYHCQISLEQGTLIQGFPLTDTSSTDALPNQFSLGLIKWAIKCISSLTSKYISNLQQCKIRQWIERQTIILFFRIVKNILSIFENLVSECRFTPRYDAAATKDLNKILWLLHQEQDHFESNFLLLYLLQSRHLSKQIL